MTVVKYVAAAGALALSACATAQPPPSTRPTDSPPEHGSTAGHTCDGSNIQQFVGQKRSDALEKQMLQLSGAAFVRWVAAGTMATMEFRSDRLTAFLGPDDRINRISCS